MHAIAYRTYVDWLRSNHHAEERSDAWWEACVAPEADPSERASANELSANLFAAVDQLDPDIRATVHLRYYQGLTVEETAEALGIRHQFRQIPPDSGSSQTPDQVPR